MSELILKGLNFLLPEQVTDKRKLPPDMRILGLWGLLYLRSKLLHELKDAQILLSNFAYTYYKDPDFEKNVEKYKDEAEFLGYAMPTVKEWFQEYIAQRITTERWTPSELGKRINRVSETIREIDSLFFNELQKSEYGLSLLTKYGNDLRKAITTYILNSAKNYKWLKELIFISFRSKGIAEGEAKAVRHKLQDVTRHFYAKKLIFNNISRIRISHKEEEKLMAGEERWKFHPFTYYSKKPLLYLNRDELEDMYAWFETEIFFTEDALTKTKVPAKALKLKEKLKKLKSAYKDLKEAKGDKEKLKAIQMKYPDLYSYNIRPPNEIIVSWWTTAKRENLIFPSMAHEYQYFLSLWVKRGKQGRIKGMKPEYFKYIKYLPRYSLWYKHHLRQVREWFKQEFTTMDLPDGVNWVFMFSAERLMQAVKVIMEFGRRINIKFFDDLYSQVFLIRQSIMFDFQNQYYFDEAKEKWMKKPLSEDYRLEKNEIIPYPPTWKPNVKLYPKKYLDELLDLMTKFRKGMVVEKIKRKRPVTEIPEEQKAILSELRRISKAWNREKLAEDLTNLLLAEEFPPKRIR